MRAAAPEQDHYAVLGLDPAAKPADVKAAYRRASRAIHPDRNSAPDAHARMAAVNAAYDVLSNADRRSDYDRWRPKPRIAPRAPATMPEEGPGAPQPAQLPDWYEFLGLRHGTSTAEVLDALRRTGAAIRAAWYAPENEALLLAQLRLAADTLSNPRTRAVYDRALEGTPPPAGTFPAFHEHWYSFLGVRPSATAERIAYRVTDLSAKARRGTTEYREIEAAWRTLRNPEKRAEYDRTIGLHPAAAETES